MLNPFRWPFRAQYFAGFVVCALLLSYAYYVQFALNIEPCPLCIFQRIVFIVMGIVFLVGAIQNPRASGRRIYGLLPAARRVRRRRHRRAAYLGAAPAARSVRRLRAGLELHGQQLPDQQSAEDGVHRFGADCSQINWTFLGFSMPEWTLICYVLLGAGAIWAAFRKR